jgi:hypothetical protein
MSGLGFVSSRAAAAQPQHWAVWSARSRRHTEQQQQAAHGAAAAAAAPSPSPSPPGLPGCSSHGECHRDAAAPSHHPPACVWKLQARVLRPPAWGPGSARARRREGVRLRQGHEWAWLCQLARSRSTAAALGSVEHWAVWTPPSPLDVPHLETRILGWAGVTRPR